MPPPTIEIDEAIVAMSPTSHDCTVLIAPDAERLRDKYTHVFGACDPFWQTQSRENLLGELLLNVWQASACLGMNAARVHECLCASRQYREIMPVETLPKQYR